MKIKLLTKEQRYDVYYHQMTRDFHSSELKPYERIEWLVEQGCYDCYGLFQTDTIEMTGYAFIAKVQVDENLVLMLDYYAICPEYRASGIGSKFLELIREHLSGQSVGLIAEVENPDYGEDEENLQLRYKRLSFYKKNEFVFSKVLSRVMMDEYRIIQLPFTRVLSDMEILHAMSLVYIQLNTKGFFEREVFIRMDEIQTDQQ